MNVTTKTKSWRYFHIKPLEKLNPFLLRKIIDKKLKKSKRWKEAIAIKIIKRCLVCGVETDDFLNPLTAVDIIIEFDKRSIILIKRKNAPRGWAMPGGFVNYGESLEEAAIREVKEETRLDIRLIRQLHTYSDPARDPRRHTISTVFIAEASGTPLAADDAEEIGIFMKDNLPQPLMFDHAKILADYFQERDSHRQLIPDSLIKCQIGK